MLQEIYESMTQKKAGTLWHKRKLEPFSFLTFKGFPYSFHCFKIPHYSLGKKQDAPYVYKYIIIYIRIVRMSYISIIS